jgi:hypothetical protein
LICKGQHIGSDLSVRYDVELAHTTGHHQKGEIFRAEIRIVGPSKDIYVTAERELQKIPEKGSSAAGSIVSDAAQGCDEPIQRELAAFDFDFGDARLVVDV